MNRKGKRIVSVCLLVAMIALTACAKGGQQEDYTGVMNIDLGKDGMIRNGTEYHTYQVEEGRQGILSVRITEVSGRLDMDVFHIDSPEDTDYTGRDLDSASFDVIVRKSGEYKIRFAAKDFVGSYEIQWKTQKNTD